MDVSGRSRTFAALWTASAGAAVVSAAWWLRDPDERYLVAAVVATVLTAALALLVPRAMRAPAWATAAASVLFVALAVDSQRSLTRIAEDWPGYRATRLARGGAALSEAFERTAQDARDDAARALDAPADPARAFPLLARLVADADQGVVLFERGRAIAWAGRAFVPVDSLVGAIGIARGPFYTTMFATAERGIRRAVATTVVHAEAPGNAIVRSVDAPVVQREGLHGFAVLPPGVHGSPAAARFRADGIVLLEEEPVAPESEEARLLESDRARTSGLPLLAVALVFLVAACWREGTTPAWRIAPLAAALAVVALAPLSALSAKSVFFDPTVYYARIGGPFTATAGALAATSAILLLLLLLAMRPRLRIRSRRWALVIAVAAMTTGPFILRALSRGVSPPTGGVTVTLWLAWEIALFLPAAVLLVAAAWAGRTALGPMRVLPVWLAPALAALGALLGTLVLQPPGDWPQWYTLLWIGVVGALAFSRPHRRTVMAASIVAACGAATLTWNAGVRGRTTLADRDLDELSVPDPDVASLLTRLGAALQAQPAPADEAALLRAYMRSDLVGAGFPVRLTRWRADLSPQATVALDPLAVPDGALRLLIEAAVRSGGPLVRPVLAMPGVLTVLVVPSPSGGATTVAVAPRTRLIADDPYMPLIGLAPREHGEPPYQVSLTGFDPAAGLTAGRTVWYRRDEALHGDRIVNTVQGARRAHIEIVLRSPLVLTEGGSLVVMLDLVLIGFIWMLSAAPLRVMRRWGRARVRIWVVSYRARLSVALFAFFLLPALGFALWSYERLRTEDVDARELVVRETLRAAEGVALPAMDSIGDRLGTPLLVYNGGLLRWSSDPLWGALSPTGHMLDPSAYLLLREGHEEFAGEVQRAGSELALFGYRAGMEEGNSPTVLGAPARPGDLALMQRRRDLAMLLAFATLLGALAAVALSRAASRALAEPIGSLRTAALAIAAGEREPPLGGAPPAEFVPVFSAFRRMTADLAASRAALEAAERRTSAVLRDVATGVVALAPDGMVTLANPRAIALLGGRMTTGAPIDRVHGAIGARVRGFFASDRDEEGFEIALGRRQVQARLARLGAGGAVLTLDDVSELARAQRVLAWGEMARQVAHEIKNPLTPIRLGIQHLQRAFLDRRGDFEGVLSDNAARILSEIDRLDEIARGFSRYGNAPAERSPAAPTDVSMVVRDVLALERMGEDGVDWRLDEPAEGAVAFANEDELREVMLNVLENARHAGARRVDVRVAPHDGRVHVEVRDDGRGIPTEVMPRLFEPHFSTRTSGSGLGLPISRQLLEGWGGAIAVASEEGKGTTVRIELRRVMA